MAIQPKFIIQAAFVEVQYRKGIVFLDKCGSIMVRLEETLAPAFEGNVPTMAQGELLNAAERMTLRYGPKAYSLTQNWVDSPVRIEQLAPPAWEQVSESMGISREVTRCGVRFILLWGVDDLAEAERRMNSAELFRETPDWVATFGEPTSRAWVTSAETREGIVRVGLSASDIEVKGGALSADLEGLVPKHSIMLDLDYVYPGAAVPFALHKGQMKDFIRNSWERGKKAAATVHARLAR